MSDIEETEAPQVLALDAWHRAAGARMVPFAGYAMPVQYAGIVEEHRWTRARAGLFDVSHMGQLSVFGDGAAEALEAVTPADLSGLAPDRMRYSLLLREDGGILDDLMVTTVGDGFHLVVNGSTKCDDIAELRERLPDAVTLRHLERGCLLALQGPEAEAALARHVPGAGELRFMESAAFAWRDEPEYEIDVAFVAAEAKRNRERKSALLEHPEWAQ